MEKAELAADRGQAAAGRASESTGEPRRRARRRGAHERGRRTPLLETETRSTSQTGSGALQARLVSQAASCAAHEIGESGRLAPTRKVG